MATPPESGADLHLEELRERLSWLIRLRWLAIAGVFVTVSVTPRLVGVPLHQRPLYLTAAALALYNAVLWAACRWSSLARERRAGCFANLQIALDLVFLTLLLHHAGGLENPLTCYYAFHVIIASILLSPAATFLQASLAVGLLAGMGVLEALGAIPHYHLAGVLAPDTYRNPRYVFAALFGMATMLYFAAFMATSITARLRGREAQVVRLTSTLRAHSDDLERAYAALGQLDRERSDYLHRAAHHLRSPLASLEHLLAVVTEGRLGPVPASMQEMLDRARRRTKGMLDLTRDLLVLSRAREASHVVRHTQVDLASLIQEAMAELRPQADQASVALGSAISSDIGVVTGDPEALGELIENLVSNAIKYTPAGGQVHVGLSPRNGQVELRVSDSGIGIPAEEKERVFDEFYRATNARESGREGTGLGLTIVKTVAESHGGSVSVESQVGAGTTFVVLLPKRARDT